MISLFNRHRIHGIGIFTYIYHKNQPFMQVNIPFPGILLGYIHPSKQKPRSSSSSTSCSTITLNENVHRAAPFRRGIVFAMTMADQTHAFHGGFRRREPVVVVLISWFLVSCSWRYQKPTRNTSEHARYTSIEFCWLSVFSFGEFGDFTWFLTTSWRKLLKRCGLALDSQHHPGGDWICEAMRIGEDVFFVPEKTGSLKKERTL